jgi:hypothetical protein
LPRFLAQIAQRPEESMRDDALDLLELVATAMPGSHSDEFLYLRRRELVGCLPALRAVESRFARHLIGLIEDEIVPGGVVPQRWRAQARPFVRHRADRLFLVPIDGRVVLVATTMNMSAGIGCWDAQTGEQLGPLIDGVAKHAYRDGSDVVIAGIDGWSGRARRWAVPSGGRVTALWSYEHAGRVYLGAGDEFGCVWRWLPGADPRPQQVNGKHHQYVLHGAAYREGNRTVLVTGATDQAAHRWDAETGASLGDPWVMKDEPLPYDVAPAMQKPVVRAVGAS